MSDIIGVAWFTDEPTYRKGLEIFADRENMPATFADWKALVERQCQLIKESGNMALRAEIDPEAFVHWCQSRGFQPDARGRTAFANHIVIEYQKTGKGTIIE
jgi:hypothetical protein